MRRFYYVKTAIKAAYSAKLPAKSDE